MCSQCQPDYDRLAIVHDEILTRSFKRVFLPENEYISHRYHGKRGSTKLSIFIL